MARFLKKELLDRIDTFIPKINSFQHIKKIFGFVHVVLMLELSYLKNIDFGLDTWKPETLLYINCLLYTSPSPRDRQKSRMPSSA